MFRPPVKRTENEKFAVKSLFDSRTKSFLNSDIPSLGVLPNIAEVLHKHELFHYLIS